MKQNLLKHLFFLLIALFFIVSCSEASLDYKEESGLGGNQTGVDYDSSGNYTGTDDSYYDYGDYSSSSDYDTAAEDCDCDAGETQEETQETPDEEAAEQENSSNENPFVSTAEKDTSTFSIDTDTGSYTLTRQYILTQAQLPPSNVIRVEEFVNYFTYDYEKPNDKKFAINTAMGVCPWNENHYLLRIALQAQKAKEIKPMHLVFLLDVSGSMMDENKLPLLKKTFSVLLDHLKPTDRISLVTYSTHVHKVFEYLNANEDKEKILEYIDSLEADGSTNGEGGLKMAYDIAEKHYNKNWINTIILATDGDFNIGFTDVKDMETFVAEKRKEGIFMITLGYGMGNYRDDTLETLADNGNGTYYYIDTESEAKRVFGDKIINTLNFVAKDVKIQVQFNADVVKKYRLIGYENRVMANEDFNDDTKDAGEIGSEHQTTAFYELILNEDVQPSTIENLGTIRIRYKEIDEDTSKLLEEPLVAAKADDEFMFASSVVEFALILKESQYKGNASIGAVIKRAKNYRGHDPFGEREEFIEIVTETANLIQ